METADRLLVHVERPVGSGAFEVDERLRVESIRQRAVGVESVASIAVRLDDGYDAEEARRRYHPDLRLVITSDDDPAERRVVLFDGYASRQGCAWRGGPGGDGEAYTLELEDRLVRLSRAGLGQVYGRRVRSLATESHLEEESKRSVSSLVTALPCVFNAGGVGNMSSMPSTVRDIGGVERRVGLFTWDGGGDSWTFGDVLLYLLWHHLPGEAREMMADLWGIAAGEGDDGGSQVAGLMRQVPVSLACESTSLVEALSLWSEASQIKLALDADMVEGRVRSRLRAWSPASGAIKRLLLARGGRREDGSRFFEPAAEAVESILLENNTHRGGVSWDHRSAPADVLVLGGVKRYEVTVPLWPGWVVTDLLDDVPPSLRGYAKALALTPAQVDGVGAAAEQYAWFQRYHRQGSLFRLDPSIARCWMLNEDGALAGALYNRYAPFDDYRAFDFVTAAGEEARAWMARPRRLQSRLGGAARVWVEVSFDAGVTWQPPSCGVRVLEDRAGIYLDCENPTEVVPAGVDPAAANMWYALVDQVFRVRVTATVEGDDRLIGRWSRVAADRLQREAMLVPAAPGYAYERRTASSVSGGSAGERDDSTRIALEAKRLGMKLQGTGVTGAPAIPWVETGYVLGDRVAEVCGKQLRLSMGEGAEGPWPAIVERRFVLREGRYETELVLG